MKDGTRQQQDQFPSVSKAEEGVNIYADDTETTTSLITYGPSHTGKETCIVVDAEDCWQSLAMTYMVLHAKHPYDPIDC